MKIQLKFSPSSLVENYLGSSLSQTFLSPSLHYSAATPLPPAVARRSHRRTALDALVVPLSLALSALLPAHDSPATVVPADPEHNHRAGEGAILWHLIAFVSEEQFTPQGEGSAEEVREFVASLSREQIATQRVLPCLKAI